jgi:hypothetical protein
MRISRRILLHFFVFFALAALPALAEETASKATKKAIKTRTRKATTATTETKLSEKVQKTLDDKFPNAKVEKVDAAKEGGVMVYDIEFREGRVHKETDIAEDGTMLEHTVFVAKKTLPKEAMKQITKAAEGNKMQRMAERIEIAYETKEGKVVKLDKPKTHYAVVLLKGDQKAEIVVDGKGTVIEDPKWQSKPKVETDTPTSKKT